MFSLNGAHMFPPPPFTSSPWHAKGIPSCVRLERYHVNDLLLSWPVQALSASLLFSVLAAGKSSLLLSSLSVSSRLPSPGSPSLSGTGTVTVVVDDVNDNVPVFTSSSFHTTVMENAPTGADVLLVNSSDADVGVNGVIRYRSALCAHRLPFMTILSWFIFTSKGPLEDFPSYAFKNIPPQIKS